MATYVDFSSFFETQPAAAWGNYSLMPPSIDAAAAYMYPFAQQPWPQTTITATPAAINQQSSVFITPDSNDRKSPVSVITNSNITYQSTPAARPGADLYRSDSSQAMKRSAQDSDTEMEAKKPKLDQDFTFAQQNVPYDMQQGFSQQVFCQVQGRLCVVGNPRSYEVTMAEVLRRVSEPECLNKSTLGPLLRRGKVKGCGDELQKLLSVRGLGLNNGQKKKLPVCTLTAFTEGEAFEFGMDNREKSMRFPAENIARVTLQGMPQGSVDHRILDAYNTVLIMDEMLALQQEWCRDERDVERMMTTPLRDLVLVSHGLGPVEWRTYIEVLRRFALAVKKVLDEHFMRQQHIGTFIFPEQPIAIPQPEEAKDDSYQLPQVDQDKETRTFCEVPGRLSLTNRKYNISVAEVKRRIQCPESLNGSILGAILRKGKTKDNGNALREELHKCEIDLPIGRRKATQTTTFTALAEEEAVIMARDMKSIIQRHFPTDTIANELNRRSRYHDSMSKLAERRIKLESVVKVIVMLRSFLEANPIPVSDRIPEIRSRYHAIMEPFALMTHGYGPDETLNWLDATEDIVKRALSLLPVSTY